MRPQAKSTSNGVDSLRAMKEYSPFNTSPAIATSDGGDEEFFICMAGGAPEACPQPW
jgi:hypothetical protein